MSEKRRVILVTPSEEIIYKFLKQCHKQRSSFQEVYEHFIEKDRIWKKDGAGARHQFAIAVRLLIERQVVDLQVSFSTKEIIEHQMQVVLVLRYHPRPVEVRVTNKLLLDPIRY